MLKAQPSQEKPHSLCKVSLTGLSCEQGKEKPVRSLISHCQAQPRVSVRPLAPPQHPPTVAKIQCRGAGTHRVSSSPSFTQPTMSEPRGWPNSVLHNHGILQRVALRPFSGHFPSPGHLSVTNTALAHCSCWRNSFSKHVALGAKRGLISGSGSTSPLPQGWKSPSLRRKARTSLWKALLQRAQRDTPSAGCRCIWVQTPAVARDSITHSMFLNSCKF